MDFVGYLVKRLEERLNKKISKYPWLCEICGEGGNFKGEVPEDYWYPPKDHVCKEKE